VQFPQTFHEIPPKHPAEDAHRQEEPGPRGNPPGAARRQAAGWDPAVDTRAVLQFLIPGMQHAE
jgi:hypothetical protein